ncbi:MAG: flippase-like domain-containing protein [candidate division Zixibacteria bacterium]|nr:flippase-like domain-containing protein [candidate division Zixibacteria bacterium]
MRKQLIIGVAISVVLLFFVFRNIDFGDFWQALKTANYWYLIPSTVLTFVSMGIRALRWQLLFEPIKRIGIHSLFSATMIGFMANNVLPARLGEFVRAYIIGRQENIAKSASFGTIVVERIFDGLVLLSFLILSFITNTTLPDYIIIFSYVLGGIYAMTLFVLFFLVIRPTETVAVFNRILGLISASMAQRAGALMNSFIEGLQILRQGSRLLGILAFSLLLWVVNGLSIHIALIGFHIAIPFTATLLVMAITGFGVTIPSSPGFVGTFHASCVLGLALFSVSQTDALSFSIVYHASQFVPITLVGLLYLWTDHLSLQEIQRVDVV